MTDKTESPIINNLSKISVDSADDVILRKIAAMKENNTGLTAKNS